MAIFAAIGSAIATVGIGTLVAYGFWCTISYLVYDIGKDYIEYKTISEKTEAERDKLIDGYITDSLADGTMTKEEALEYYDEIRDAKEEEKGSIFDQLSRLLGLDKNTLIWVIVGIIIFTLLKG